ncbi:hypothetical protein Sdia_24040 [Streptomyces diastaticus subsp. diastaticus]|uniref:Uncharacterized protein n=1 Tax=Streptomyces diastaticus subsp. diastaticus TaxID=68040 RepID=A0ABQ1CNK6_STRDI|nr:hypothetical protein [Streptomyces diastaticus]WTD02115.1 hypothetical protein OH717_05795 [Streptomyces albidoflavus]GFH71636.1 hypothetical protein Sdia_24040 [Streptomyces diastaticus subsp. diastaticus]GGU13684.1 hypothetical protein GCM10015534_15590 [Streptomyces diastaticus subsp. diastaticus]
MSSTEKWTPDHLLSPASRAIHLEQRRAQLLPIVDDIRRLAREMSALVGEMDSIEGDLPGQAALRARHVTKPLFKAADDVEAAVGDLVAFNQRYQRSYEELPEKRAEKREAKHRRKLEKAGGSRPEIGSGPTSTAPAKTDAKFDDIFDGLRRGA